MTAVPEPASPTSTPVRVPVELAHAVADAMPRADLLDWVLWAWGVLVQAGQGCCPDLSDRADVDDVIGLAALGRSLSTFSEILDGTPGADHLCPELLGDGEPWVSDLALGKYCERHGIYTGEEPEVAHALLDLAIADREPMVRAELLRVLGDARLFTSMRQAARPQDCWSSDDATDDQSPLRSPSAPGLWAAASDGLARAVWTPDLSDVEIGAAVNSGLTTEHHMAFEWIVNG